MSPTLSSRSQPHRFRLLAAIVILAVFGLATTADADAPETCVVPDNGSGTADLPPAGCAYVALSPLMIVDGLPPGEPILCSARLSSFFDITYLTGGTLNGEIARFHGGLEFGMTGVGGAGSFRPAFFDIFTEVHMAPRPPHPAVQSFDTDMFAMQGQLPPGDPDFDLLRITAGGGFGLPSPGHTTLTLAPGGGWAVDSFFDITYRIDFVGAPSGPLSGRSGSTTGTIRMQCGTSDPVAVEDGTWGEVKALFR